MHDESARNAFENFAEDSLSLASEFVEDAPQIETIWIYVSMEADDTVAAAFFKADGTVYDSDGVTAAIGRSGDWAPSPAFVLQLAALADDLHDAFQDSAEVPTRIVLTYDTASGSMDADFGYHSLLDNPEDTLDTVAQAWFENLTATGDASA